MIRLLHLSDVHFGAVDDRLVQPMVDLATQLRPDAVVVSGDLTQRARPAQFAAARAFVSRLPAPALVVPGNHDMPLWNLPLRLLGPFFNYRRAFGPTLQPRLTLPGVILQGLNTANPYVWKSGHLPARAAEMLKHSFAPATPGDYRIAVMHHAPVPAADGTPADIADPSAVLAQLAAAGTDIVLSGHTHLPHSGVTETAAGILFLQVGTAISTRLKTDANDVSLIELTAEGVTQHSWIARNGQPFQPATTARFHRTGAGWQPAARI